MSRLYRKTADGIEALYPETVAENVRYGDGTVADALAGAPEGAGGVTGVKGACEAQFRKGDVNLSAADIGAASAAHTHTPADIGAAASHHAHAVATQSADGFLSAADKAKLDGLGASGAPALLWSGSWTSGSITVPNFSAYRLFVGTLLITTQGVDAVFAHMDGTTDCVAEATFFGSASYTLRVIFEPTGDTLTMQARTTTGQTKPTLTAIYGIL